MIYGKSEPSIRICTYVREARHARPDHYDVATDERQKHADEILADSPRAVDQDPSFRRALCSGSPPLADQPTIDPIKMHTSGCSWNNPEKKVKD